MTSNNTAKLFKDLFEILSSTAKYAGFKRIKFGVSEKMLKRSVASGYFSMDNHAYHDGDSLNCVKFAFRGRGTKTAKIEIRCPDLITRLSFVNSKASRDLNRDISWYSGVMILLELCIAHAITQKTTVPSLKVQDQIIVLAEKIRDIV